jgi:hypothetical protein
LRFENWLPDAFRPAGGAELFRKHVEHQPPDERLVFRDFGTASELVHL